MNIESIQNKKSRSNPPVDRLY